MRRWIALRDGCRYVAVTGMHPDKSGNVVFRWLDIAFTQMYIRNDVDALKAAMKS